MSSISFKYAADEDNVALFYQHLTLDNAGVTRDANVDGTTPKVFSFGDATNTAVICSAGFEMTDAKNWSLNEFANLGAALSNGIAITVYDTNTTTEIANFTEFENIKTNIDWYQYFPDTRYIDFGTGDTEALITGRVRMDETLGAPVVLKPGVELRVTISDNLTGVSKLHFFVAGYWGYGRPGNVGVRGV